jgi:hypothetical protein
MPRALIPAVYGFSKNLTLFEVLHNGQASKIKFHGSSKAVRPCMIIHGSQNECPQLRVLPSGALVIHERQVVLLKILCQYSVNRDSTALCVTDVSTNSLVFPRTCWQKRRLIFSLSTWISSKTLE